MIRPIGTAARTKYKEFQHQEVCEEVRDFPGGLVVNNPPATGGDMGSVPGWGRSQLWDS